MATTRRTTARNRWLWRWRRNSLRRRSDRVEAWIVLVTWFFVLLAGAFAGQAAAGAVQDGLDARRAQSSPVRAVLAEDAAKRPQTTPYADGAVWAQVRWTAADGSARTGLAKVGADSKAGSTTTVWTDRTGELVPRPATAAEARLQALLLGALAGLGAAGGVLAGGWLVRGRLERRRLQAWDREWEQIGPRWRRTIG
ncbi:hypothetical protein ACFSL4_13910 [Streptomyces caeni]|uniref:Uncharacterized protein n=1 Tax=Streptomyces caeni TaxID=2307231 RepID=A0ABW4IQT9_9ACTN